MVTTRSTPAAAADPEAHPEQEASGGAEEAGAGPLGARAQSKQSPPPGAQPWKQATFHHCETLYYPPAYQGPRGVRMFACDFGCGFRRAGHDVVADHERTCTRRSPAKVKFTGLTQNSQVDPAV
jgi:hypothetical protein